MKAPTTSRVLTSSDTLGTILIPDQPPIDNTGHSDEDLKESEIVFLT